MGRNEPYCGAVYVVLFLMADYVSGLLRNMVNIRKVNTPLLVAGYKSLRIKKMKAIYLTEDFFIQFLHFPCVFHRTLNVRSFITS